ncbi:MAG: hypothetical protein WB586_26555 [Chthoniobacterales bacterium]
MTTSAYVYALGRIEPRFPRLSVEKEYAQATERPDESQADYLLGNTDAEHERLIRQAIRLAPVTERFFREAGIGSGQSVLELGSGVGDVAMLPLVVFNPHGLFVWIKARADNLRAPVYFASVP